ncbi:helix-turn-helix transcriptional regulator [Umezawaea sp. Da 62-37]|uniref:helix-turn-helix domain-containing protein n=1 Tax=Umezawaea sp. Da 62-37 TaxID=3075927 RepID=UPI0028F74BB9|nr:helix-turn-helix transcriptional regulator [Umezawaea sp. Da 62-37]WNV91321.1 helix-turn-helix transcriptional regulator [Umezawaea sp. Da 62-37]
MHVPTGESSTMEFERALANIAGHWAQVRQDNGEPSLRVLAARTGLSTATIHRALQGKKFPKWQVVQGILIACGVREEEIPRWRGQWAAVRRLKDSAVDPLAPLPTAVQPEPAGGCPTCGALIIDLEQHERWHNRDAG